MNAPSVESVDEIVRSLLPRLYRTAFYLTRNGNEADDAVQETLARLVEAGARGRRSVRRPLAWSLRVLVRICIARRRERRRELTGLDLSKEEPMVGDLRPDEELEAQELRASVRQSMGELPPDEREAVALHVFGELTVREVARTIGVSRSTAHARIRHGLDRLARRLQGSLAMAAPGAPMAEAAEALRAVPDPPIPDSLVAAVTHDLGAVAGSAAQTLLTSTAIGTTAMATGGALMTKGSVTLLVATGILAVTSLGLGLRLGDVENDLALARSAAARGESSPGRLQELAADRQRLDLSNARLRDELARLRRTLPVGAASEQAGPGIPRQPQRTTGGETIEALRQRTEAAFRARDAAAFRASFLALLDIGPAAHAELIELLRLTGGYNQLFAEIAPEDYDFRRELMNEVSVRGPRLAALADAILTREGEPDAATLYAYDLIQHNRVRSARSSEEQAETFLGLLERALDGEGDRVEWNLHLIGAAELLGRTGRREALPDLRALLAREGLSEDNRIFLLRSVARLGGSAAVDVLREVHQATPPALRGRLLGNVAMYDSGSAEVESFLRELGETAPDAEVREAVQKQLARRERDHRSALARLADGTASRDERMETVERLLRGGGESEREAAWAHFQREAEELQDEMLVGLASTEPRALELLLDRIETGRVSGELSGGMGRLDAKLVHAHRQRFERAAGEVSLPLQTRAAAAAALAKVEPGAAVRALALGFEAGSEADRLAVVDTIRHRVGGDEAAAFLESVAAADPSTRVRDAAHRSTEGR